MLNVKKLLHAHLLDLLAVVVLVVFTFISVLLIHHESATTDEQAHIPAAYSYVMLDNFTLNPEHPPLAKLISGIGFIGSHFNFPTKVLNNNNKLGDRQWQVGAAFLYHSGNNTDSILLRSRLPILAASVIGLFACYLLFAAVSTKKIALYALTFMALSPTVIAHGHLVTTDILVMTTMAIAMLCFIRLLKEQSWAFIIIAGITLAIAELSKFSTVLLFIFYPLAAVLFYYAKKPSLKAAGAVKLMLRVVIPTFSIALAFMYAVYALQVIHLSHTAQNNWIVQATGDPVHHLGTRILLDINKVPPLAPVVRYIVGFSSSLGRVAVGHGANLLGKDYATSTPLYFPVVSTLKTPSPLLALWVVMAVYLGGRLKIYSKKRTNLLGVLLSYTKANPVPTLGALITLVYFVVACIGHLDIGVRHLLPVFPWVAFLSALWIVTILEKFTYKTLRIGIVLSSSILTLFVFIALIVYPNYIPYTTEVAGGAPQAYRYYNDSNVDWGQSIKYLAAYVQTHPDELPLYTDQSYADAKNYYTCGNANLCPKLYILGDTQQPPKGSYFAVSETHLTIDWARSPDNLAFLKKQTPLVKIGDSIYVYHIR
ncbi:MAG TPA: glycosyltransferase family 39 protein [Patescibacteria group bacterium]|nr:glycosyltransferase family 39 protein [Patescibacteria group bacterium]